ncbi:MAG: hypothetical protein U0575_15200 [Phycisphaerales bacterium]
MTISNSEPMKMWIDTAVSAAESDGPMDDVIVVKELIVRVATGDPSEDPHGQGFSAIYAVVETNDTTTIERLIEAKQRRASVTIRCAMLDVFGPITKAGIGDQSHKFILAVDRMSHRTPGHSPPR